MSRLFATFSSEGFKANAIELDDKSIIIEKADADIDADGANGQSGARAAYMVGDRGTEFLANGGMGMVGGRVVGIKSWYKDIVLLDPNGEPRLFGNVIASKTAYRWPTKKEDTLDAYIDSETIPYICVPPEIIAGVKGYVMGCKCIVRHRVSGKTASGMVADVGPRRKIGEISIEMARELGLNPSPRTGGEDKPLLDYFIFPNIHARIGGDLVPMLSSKGNYIYPQVELPSSFTL